MLNNTDSRPAHQYANYNIGWDPKHVNANLILENEGSEKTIICRV